VITVAGESGAGKSEIAYSLAEYMEQNGWKTGILQQDDYFFYPPKTNAAKRVEDIKHVGIQEVRMDLLDENAADFKKGKRVIMKPLVIFEEDRITEEVMNLEGKEVLIAEGTYTTALEQVDFRIFINRDVNDTREARLERNREKQDEFLEKILQIEHEIISKHKALADIIITKNFDAKPANHV
jgi:uridine kinase